MDKKLMPNFGRLSSVNKLGADTTENQ